MVGLPSAGGKAPLWQLAHWPVTRVWVWSNRVGVQRLVDAFKHVCVDAAGKSAVKGKVKTIRAINVWDEDKVSATLSGGTFTVKLRYGYMPPGMNETDIAGALIKAL